MTRRDFIGNALAALGFSALPGGFLFAAPEGWKPGKKPNLVFGGVENGPVNSSSQATTMSMAPAMATL